MTTDHTHTPEDVSSYFEDPFMIDCCGCGQPLPENKYDTYCECGEPVCPKCIVRGDDVIPDYCPMCNPDGHARLGR